MTIECTQRAFHMLRFVGGIWISPTGEHGPVNSGRAIRRCLLAGAIDGRSDGCFGFHASSAQTPPAASTGHESACTDRTSTYGAGPADGGGAVVFDCRPELLAFLWMSLVSTCRQSGLRYRLQGLMSPLPNVSSHSGGGGGRFA